jgi:hypothetical protein
MIFLDCPAYLDRDGTRRCGLPAEVNDKYTMPSTGGPVDCARICCPAGHWFNGPAEFLVLPAPADLLPLPAASGRLPWSATPRPGPRTP